MGNNKDETDKELDRIISLGTQLFLRSSIAAEYGAFIRKNRDIMYPILESCVMAGIVTAIDNHITDV